MKNKVAVIIFSLIFCPFILADQLSDIKMCSKIKNDPQRLQCYDKVLDLKETNPLTDIIQTKPPITSVPPITHKPVSEQQKTVKKAEVSESISKTDIFGLTETKGLQSLESSIVGTFKGWKKGDKIHLKNGQTWQVKSQNSGYVKFSNPKISITRGFLGSFNAKVEGLNARAKVKRVK